MKNLYISFLMVVVLSNTVLAQESNSNTIVYNVKTIVEKNALTIEWDSDKPADSYWQIQASSDGKKFISVGHVFGRNVSVTSKAFAFKMKYEKSKNEGLVYRVVWMENSLNGWVGQTLKL